MKIDAEAKLQGQKDLEDSDDQDRELSKRKGKLCYVIVRLVDRDGGQEVIKQ